MTTYIRLIMVSLLPFGGNSSQIRIMCHGVESVLRRAVMAAEKLTAQSRHGSGKANSCHTCLVEQVWQVWPYLLGRAGMGSMAAESYQAAYWKLHKRYRNQILNSILL